MNTKDNSRVWIILPTYNEAENLPRMHAALRAQDLTLRILVVDDGSPDGTGAIADELAARDVNFEVLHRTGKLGLGTAYLAGFQHALDGGARAVFSMDCDFSHDPASIPGFIDALDEVEVVVGSRYVKGGRTINWGLHRKVLSAAANLFVRALFGMKVADCTSGFRLYGRRAAQKILDTELSSSGYSFQVEALYSVVKTGAAIREVPICFNDREEGQSKMGMNEILSGMKSLLQVRQNELMTAFANLRVLRAGNIFRSDP
jgi:dolichol-phosphate mannosyltransferase